MMRRRAGYSFTEVMFAVVILGIGFIMIAAIFPAAILQSKTTAEETTSVAVARAAVTYLSQVADNATMPGTGAAPAPVRAFDGTGAGWMAIRGNLISEHDPRFAWVPLYRRVNLSSLAQVFIINTQVRNHSSYTIDEDLVPPPASPLANLQARAIHLTMFDDYLGSGVDRILISDGALKGSAKAAAEGAFIVIGVDNAQGGKPGLFNGRMYRLGTAVDTDMFELIAGNDYSPDLGADGAAGGSGVDADTRLPTTGDSPDYAEAFVVGRNFVGGAGTASDPLRFDGIAQDISIYTTYVRVAK